MLWTQKFAPQKLSDIAGNKDAIFRLRQWALGFGLGKKQKPILLYGPTGCAKTAIAHALAQELSFEAINLLPPAKEEYEKWEHRMQEAFSGSSLFGSSTLVIIDDIDNWKLSKIRGVVPKLTSLLKTGNVPVILSAQDAYDRAIATLRPYCELVQLKSINNTDILSTLSKISDAEKLAISKSTLQQISINCKGDLRAAINDLQAKNAGASREQSKQQFEILRACFRSPTYASTKGLDLGPLMERDSLKLYISENMPSELFDLADLTRGFERLSRADVFDGRIRTRQYWGYLRYSSSLVCWGISSERRHVKASFSPYSFPSYIRSMGATRAKRASLKSISQKIAPVLHVTTKRAGDFVPLIRAQAESFSYSAQCVSQMQKLYSLDDEELASLVGVAPDKIKSANAKPDSLESGE
ncbi:MAG: AAA family ATPase [Candidatus Micrarchaeia archaeon]